MVPKKKRLMSHICETGAGKAVPPLRPVEHPFLAPSRGVVMCQHADAAINPCLPHNTAVTPAPRVRPFL